MGVGMSDRGSLHAGLGEWVLQRLTAVYMLFFLIILVFRFAVSPVVSYADWQQLSTSLLFQVSLLLFIFSLLAHAWLGMKSVLLDYVHPWRIRFMLLSLLAVLLLATASWALLVILT